MRIVIVGGPRVGKSTLAGRIAAARGCPRMCTDPVGMVKTVEPGVEYVPDAHGEWSAASQYVADEFLGRPGPWVLDGVGAARALRKWHEAYPGTSPPADKVLVVTGAKVPITPGQATMTQGVNTVMRELNRWLFPVLDNGDDDEGLVKTSAQADQKI